MVNHSPRPSAVRESLRDYLILRSQAVRILTQVLSHHIPLDEAFSLVCDPSLSSEERAWLQEVCSGTLRWKGRLDSVLDTIALKKKPSGWLRKVLLTSTYQLIAQDQVRAASIVSETVSLVRKQEGDSPAKFANACLRKIAEHAPGWRSQAYSNTFDEEESAHWASLPLWIWKQLVFDHGLQWSVSYAQASLERPTVWARWRQLSSVIDNGTLGPVPGSWQFNDLGKALTDSSYSRGEWIIQDISIQKVIEEMTNRIKTDSSVNSLKAFDLCASPGGKSVALAWNGFQVTATEKIESRVPLLRESISRAAPQIEFIPWEKIQNLDLQDLVWVDAPCSGTGILRRHPDVRWLRQEKELTSLRKTQSELIQLGWNQVKPGGHLVYSVCSLLKEEGPQIVEHSGLTEFAVQSWLCAPQDPPYGDGFWAVCLRKK